MADKTLMHDRVPSTEQCLDKALKEQDIIELLFDDATKQLAM